MNEETAPPSPAPAGAYLFAGATVFWFLLEVWAGGSTTSAVLRRLGSTIPTEMHDEPWRVLSYALLHAGFFHIFMNLYALYVLGALHERILGVGRFLLLLVLGALGGGIAAWKFSNAPVVGASSSIWALLGASGALALRPHGILRDEVIGEFRKGVLSNLLLQLAYSFAPGVSLAGHLGGGVVGFFAALFLFANVWKSGRNSLWNIVGAVAFVLFIGSGVIAFAKGKPWELRNNGTWQRAVLPGAGLSAELPTAPKAHARNDQMLEFLVATVSEWGFGCALVVSPPFAEPMGPEQAERELQAMIGPNQLSAPENFVPDGPARIETIGGNRFVVGRFHRGTTEHFYRAVQLRTMRSVSIELYYSDETPGTPASIGPRIAASLREQ